MRPVRRRCLTAGAFTLLEVTTVIVIIMILATMLVQLYGMLQSKAMRAACQANLRSLHIAASAYVTDYQHWPQLPPTSVDDPQYALNWIAAFKPYKIQAVNWICPAVQTGLGDIDYLTNVRVDYFGTKFDASPRSPFLYPTHPWFLERGDMHGDGNLVIFANGQIKSIVEIRRDLGHP